MVAKWTVGLRPVRGTALSRRVLLVAAVGLAPRPALASETYTITPAVASVLLHIRQLALFGADARFQHFQGELKLDRSMPERTAMSLVLDAGSVEMSDQIRTDRIRSEEFLDVAHYQQIRFVSDAVQPLTPAHWRVAGRLTIRGITQPLLLDSHLIRVEGRIATLEFTGSLSRSAFGITADKLLIADIIGLQVNARLRLDD